LTLMIVLSLLTIGLICAALVWKSHVFSQQAHKTYPPAGLFIHTDQGNMHIIQQGDKGPAVLMLHGASANAREFTWSLAPRLAATHRLFCMDRPGHGYSDRPDEGHKLGIQAELAARTLARLAPDEPVTILGHSFGGAVALRLALDYPDQVRGLVLLAPVTHDWGGGGEAWYSRYAAHPWIGPVFNHLPNLIGPAQVHRSINKVFAPQVAPANYYEHAAIQLLFRPAAFRANAEDVTALRKELAAQQARYASIRHAVIVFSGAGDTVLSPKLHAGRLKREIDHLELIRLAEGGHMPHHAYGDEIAEAIRRVSLQPAV